MRRSTELGVRGGVNNAIFAPEAINAVFAPEAINAVFAPEAINAVFAPEAQRILAGGGAQRNHRNLRRNLSPAPEGRQTVSCLSPLRGWKDDFDCVRWFLHRLISGVPPGRIETEDRGSWIVDRGSRHLTQGDLKPPIFNLRSAIRDPRSAILLRVFLVLPVFVFAILTSSPCAFAQFRPTSRQVSSEAQGSRADQLPLSGRSGQTGSVTATQNPTPGATTSVNTINPAIQTQGPFSGSVWGAARAPFSGRLSLREAVGRGIDFNLGAVGLTNAVSESRAQRKIVRSALLPSISGYLSETVDRKSVVEGN